MVLRHRNKRALEPSQVWWGRSALRSLSQPCFELHFELPKHQRFVANIANMSSQFELAQNPTEPISKVAFSPRTPTRLLVSSWDRHVYLYDTHGEPGGKLLQKFEHRAPVLDVCFGRDDNEAFSAGLDWEVRRCNCSSCLAQPPTNRPQNRPHLRRADSPLHPLSGCS